MKAVYRTVNINVISTVVRMITINKHYKVQCFVNSANTVVQHLATGCFRMGTKSTTTDRDELDGLVRTTFDKKTRRHVEQAYGLRGWRGLESR